MTVQRDLLFPACAMPVLPLQVSGVSAEKAAPLHQVEQRLLLTLLGNERAATYWHTYIRLLPSKADFQAMMSGIDKTFKSDIAIMCQDIKAIAGRVELVEEAKEDMRNYTS